MNQERGREQQSRVKCRMSIQSESAKKLTGRTKPFCRKSKAGTMKRRNVKASKVQTERRGSRNAECGMRIAEGRATARESPVTVRQGHRRRVTDHGPRITNHAKAHGPNEPTAVASATPPMVTVGNGSSQQCRAPGLGKTNAESSELRTQLSALSSQLSALSSQHSALTTQFSALSTQHSALSLSPQSSVLPIPNCRGGWRGRRRPRCRCRRSRRGSRSDRDMDPSFRAE